MGIHRPAHRIHRGVMTRVREVRAQSAGKHKLAGKPRGTPAHPLTKSSSTGHLLPEERDLAEGQGGDAVGSFQQRHLVPVRFPELGNCGGG